MDDPLGDRAAERLASAASEYLRDRGFRVERPDTRAEPPAIAEPAADADPADALDGPADGVPAGERPFGVEPVLPGAADPTTIASRVGHAVERDRRVLFVVDDAAVADAVRDVLATPRLLAGVSDGYRVFHAGPDRVPVAEGGYACLVGDADDVRWRETGTPLGPVPGIETAGHVDGSGRPVPPRLVCEVDGEVQAVLGGVGALRDPPAEAFPYRYRRDPDDKQFHVLDGDREVGAFEGVAAMRAAGYAPAPMPLVPEHVLGDADLAGAWALLRVGSDERLLRR